MTSETERIEMIAIGKVKPDPNQPRTEWDKHQEHITQLAESFKEVGLIEPVVVDENNIIILGECRWRAAKEAKMKRIPIRRRTVKDEDERFQLQLIEDLHKKELTEIERRWAYAAAIMSINEDRHYTIDEIKEIWSKDPRRLFHGITSSRVKDKGQSKLARSIGTSQTTVSRLLQYFSDQISDETRDATDRGLISHREIGEISRIKTKKAKESLVKAVTKERMEKRQRDQPTQQLEVSVIDRVEAIREIEDRGGSDELLTAAAEAEIEPDDAEALADVPVDAQPEAVKIVKKQPTAFARKVVARQISVEVPQRAAEVKVSEERIKSLRSQAEAHDRRMAEVDADPRVKEVQRLYRSSTVLFGLQGEIENAFCPVCGEDATEQLRFLCHPKLNIDDAYDMTMKKHRKLRDEKEGDG